MRGRYREASGATQRGERAGDGVRLLAQGALGWGGANQRVRPDLVRKVLDLKLVASSDLESWPHASGGNRGDPGEADLVEHPEARHRQVGCRRCMVLPRTRNDGIANKLSDGHCACGRVFSAGGWE